MVLPRSWLDCHLRPDLRAQEHPEWSITTTTFPLLLKKQLATPQAPSTAKWTTERSYQRHDFSATLEEIGKNHISRFPDNTESQTWDTEKMDQPEGLDSKGLGWFPWRGRRQGRGWLWCVVQGTPGTALTAWPQAGIAWWQGGCAPLLELANLPPGCLLYMLWCKEMINTSPQKCLSWRRVVTCRMEAVSFLSDWGNYMFLK